MPIVYATPRQGAEYPTSQRRGRFWEQWEDPTGLVWQNAWDFTRAPGGAAPVPARVGGAALSVTADTYSIASGFPADVRAGQGYMAGPGFAVGGALGELLGTITPGTGPIHLRLIARTTVATTDYEIQYGPIGANYLRISENSTFDRWLARWHSSAGANLRQAEVTVPIGTTVVKDVSVYNDTGTDTRIDTRVNGTLATSSIGTESFTGTLLSGRFFVSWRAFEIGWIGVRRAVCSGAEHLAAVGDVLV